MAWDADYRVSRAAAGPLCKNAAPLVPTPSMSTTPPPAAPGNREPFWRLSRRTWLLIAAAFGIGLLLFLLLWSGKREHDFFRANPTAAPDAAGNEFEPLPAPLPAGEDGRPAEPQRQAETPDETPRVIEKTPPPSAAPSVEPPSRPATASATPTPIQTPAPRYPAQAARRGLGGTVRVRADVDADGVPVSVAVVEGSGTRELDRAALDAVRRWRFRPGMVDGRPVPGSVVVPIEFSMQR